MSKLVSSHSTSLASRFRHTLITLHNGPYPTSWNNIPLTMRHLLLNFIHFPTLNDLNLKLLAAFPISHLIPGPNLKHLSSTNLFLADESEATALVSFESIKLWALDIALWGPVKYPWLSAQNLLARNFSDGWPILDLTGLEKIFIQLHSVQFAVLVRQVFQTARQLTDILPCW